MKQTPSIFLPSIASVAAHRYALTADIKRNMRLALPLIGAQLLSVCNGVVDTLVAGQMGRDELAGVGIGSSLWIIVLLAGIGLMAGLSPTMAREIGRGRIQRVGPIFRQGCLLAVVLALFGLLILTWFTYAIKNWDFSTALATESVNYLNYAKWGIVPAILMLPMRNVCEAASRTKPILFVQCIGIVVNTLSDLGFGLGWFGLPALGLKGIGYSTSIVMLAMCLPLVWLLRGRGFRRYTLFAQLDKPHPALLKQLLTLSIPICLTLLFEAGLFTYTAVQMGYLGSLATSAHNIAIGVTALCFMLPLGLSLALTARIGVAFGKNALPSIRLRITSGLLITLCMASFSALALLTFRHSITALYTDDEAVRMLAAQLLVLAAVFQLSDDLQVTLLGMLRGLHDTRMPMLINMFSYWIVAAGLGYIATHLWNWGPFGLWFGLIVGLSLSAVLLLWRLRVVVKNLAFDLP